LRGVDVEKRRGVKLLKRQEVINAATLRSLLGVVGVFSLKISSMISTRRRRSTVSL